MNTQDQPQPAPNPDLKSLERLVGKWTMSGDTQGTVIYEWKARLAKIATVVMVHGSTLAAVGISR